MDRDEAEQVCSKHANELPRVQNFDDIDLSLVNDMVDGG